MTTPNTPVSDTLFDTLETLFSRHAANFNNNRDNTEVRAEIEALLATPSPAQAEPTELDQISAVHSGFTHESAVGPHPWVRVLFAVNDFASRDAFAKNLGAKLWGATGAAEGAEPTADAERRLLEQHDGMTDEEITLFRATLEGFADCGETETDYEVLVDWARRGFLECTNFRPTAAGHRIVASKEASADVAEKMGFEANKALTQLQFFRDLTERQRIDLFSQFKAIPVGAENEVNSHTIEHTLFNIVWGSSQREEFSKAIDAARAAQKGQP